jgi:GTP cyclohydrolase I
MPVDSPDCLPLGHAANGTQAADLPETCPPVRQYDPAFAITPAYREALPDLQNGPEQSIRGSHVPIQQVGIHNFRLPLCIQRPDHTTVELEASVTGTVSLEAHRKGINMSRIMRTFYSHHSRCFSLDSLEEVLRDYRDNLDSPASRLIIRFRYPVLNPSLRSGLDGYQYYEVAYEGRIDQAGQFHKYLHLDFVYASTCPCSYELAQHAITTRGVAAVAHSQRSVARVSVALAAPLWIEELRDLCLAALQTETQVIVKREDEQAFAELNAANLKFVEDAVRLLYEQLAREPRISDFRIVASHQESLHSHDAVSVLVKGVAGGFSADIEPNTLTSLIHKL